MTTLPPAVASGPVLATGMDLGDVVRDVSFAAMGSTVHLVVVDGPPGSLDDARALVARLEAHWSRFRPASDLSRLNRADGAWTTVHRDTIVLLDHARTGWRATNGRFDPTVLPAMLAAGYDATFRVVAARPDPPASADDRTGTPLAREAAVGPAPGLAGLELDRRRGRARLPRGVAVDPGAIGKGLAADLVVERLLGRGAAGAMANLGGDLRVAGEPPVPEGWGVEVVLPGRSDTVLLGLSAGAVATSTPARRGWRHAGRTVHHLVDPATGRPARHPAGSATVVAGAGWLAEVLATALVLGGPGGDVAATGATGLVLVDGVTRLLPGMEEYLR